MSLETNNKLNEFERYAKKAMLHWQVPGMAAAIVQGDKLIYSMGFGTKKLGTNNPVDQKTVFQIGSVSKSFTATLVSMLVDEGKLNWKDKVKDHLPNFKLHALKATCGFTIEDLMSQRSGLPPHSGRLLPYLGFPRSYIIEKLHFIKPVGDFRSEYGYQNNLFLAAAAIIEKYYGKSWEVSLYEKILQPLGMESTTSTLEGYRNSGNCAHCHYYNGPEPTSPVITIPMDWPHHHWVYTVAPAGGINSNIIDIAKWLKVHMGGGIIEGKRLVSEKNIKLMHSPKIIASQGVWGEKRYYCEGWVHSEYTPYPVIWHNGGTSGMKSIIAMVPEENIGIVVLCNLYESLLPEALAMTWFDIWFKKPHHNWSLKLLEMQKAKAEHLGKSPAPNTRPRPLRVYAGTYYNDLYGPITVGSTGKLLTVTMGPKKIRKNLKSWGGDTFVLYWPGVLTNGAGVQFYAGKRGVVDTIKVEGMTDDLTGVFTRKLL